MGNIIYKIYNYCKELCIKKKVREEYRKSSKNNNNKAIPEVIRRPTLVTPLENTHTIV